MEAKFFLREQNKAMPDRVITLAVFDSRFPKRKFFYSTGQRLKSSDWKGPKDSYGLPKATAANVLLLDYLNKLSQAVRDWGKKQIGKSGSDSLNRDDLRDYLKDITESQGKEEQHQKAEQLQKESDFFKVWQKIIDSTKGKGGEKISTSTRLSKNQTLNLVTKYCLEKNLTLTFDAIDMDFYHAFNDYMTTQGLSPNSIGKHFKEIKSILREAQDRDISVNNSYQKKSFKVIRKDSENIYLNEEEIKKMLTLKLTPAKETIRDLFVMACFVGVRHSDWHQIRQANIVKDNFLKIKQKKTGDAIHIPVHPLVRIILNKYNGEPPRVISNQKFNDSIKDICKAGLKDENKKPLMVTINGKSVEKWVEVSTHTARRSFATNAYLSRSMSVYSIMSCTGHKTETSFLKYLKLSGLDKAQDLMDSKFFSDEGWTALKIA